MGSNKHMYEILVTEPLGTSEYAGECSFSLNLCKRILDVTAGVILQPFRHFTYVRIHSPTIPSLYLCHSSFSNPSIASPTTQFILQPFFRFSYVTGSSLTSPGEPPMLFNFGEIGLSGSH